MRNLSVLLLCAIALAGCNRADAPASSREPSSPNAADARAATETARLNAWLDARYEEKLAFSPIEQTMLGRKTSYDKIDEMSESAQDAEFAWQRQTVEELQRSFDYTQLTPDGKLSYDVWGEAMKTLLALLRACPDNQIVISDATRRLAADEFAWTRAGELDCPPATPIVFHHAEARAR